MQSVNVSRSSEFAEDMQMLGSYFGASLEKLSGHAGTRHALITNEEYAKHFSKTVNSYHNFLPERFPQGNRNYRNRC